MEIKHFISTKDAKIVFGKYGPLLRFTFSQGIIEPGETGRKFITETFGCLGRTYTEKDDNEQYTTTKIFKWSPPLLQARSRKPQLLMHVSPDIYDAVLEALKKQGAIDSYVKEVEKYEVTQMPKIAQLENVLAEGTVFL